MTIPSSSATLFPEGPANLPMDSFRFKEFTLQRRARRLVRGDEDLAIGARAFDLLDLLIAQDLQLEQTG